MNNPFKVIFKGKSHDARLSMYTTKLDAQNSIH